jgi:4-hydroxy-tetrahydrodipicolinate synthase
MTGLFAAVATPLGQDGAVDLSTLDRLLDFLLGAGVDGVVIGGATGEYPHFDVAERVRVTRHAAARMPRDRALLVGIGTPAPRHAVELGHAALDAGARALLLPMPLFYRYGAADLQAYCASVSRELRGPCLLYDLPDFTNPLPRETALALLEEEEFITGLKDSSGREENLGVFASARRERAWTLLVGDDRLLHAGLNAGWDGGISGLAGFCPELLVALCRSFDALRLDEAARLQGLVNELATRVSVLPTPWGIRAGLSARGLSTGPFPLPLTAEREHQILEFTGWFLPWLERAELPILKA